MKFYYTLDILRVNISAYIVLMLLLCFSSVHAATNAYDPLEYSRNHKETVDAAIPKIPAQCYTKTTSFANPCWACHTTANGHNDMDDWKLQTADGFNDRSNSNHWQNLFLDKSRLPLPTDADVLAYISEDNYTPLRNALRDRIDYHGWRPDIDLSLGFDALGFAVDGSQWRAIRYKPFLGAFWPTNGSTDDVYIRLPPQFRSDERGKYVQSIYRANLAILEAAMAVSDASSDGKLTRVIEPTDERLAGMDLNHDGRVGGVVSVIVGLPAHYVGGAKNIPVYRYAYPQHTEFLHTVRYVDSRTPNLLSARIKEVRYSIKYADMSPALIKSRYLEERSQAPETEPTSIPGSPDAGYENEFGWRLQGFIEDADGRLRTQTTEEHYFCMGCHESIGVTVDQTFAFARKIPGEQGWRNQNLKGQYDVPQAGQSTPEYLMYMQRVRGADELRSNAEMNAKFFKDGVVEDKQVQRAAKGGDKDLAWLLAPSPERALSLDRSYMQLVRLQKFEWGRDVILTPPENIYHTVPDPNKPEDHAPVPTVYKDGRLWLDW